MSTHSETSGCLGMIFQLLGITPKSEAPAGPLPYRLRDDFLSPAEISFYHVLRMVAGDSWAICSKVRLADVFFVAQPNKNHAARNRIAQKHVDFLLCEPRTMKPRAGIELDDGSHDSEERTGRDTFVDDVFAAASLPLLRIRVQAVYQPSELAERLANVLTPGMRPAPQEAAPAADAAAASNCPKCGIPLVKRTGPRGAFFGCANFPRCRETQQLQ